MNVIHINSYFETNLYEEIYSRLRDNAIITNVIIPIRFGDSRYDDKKDKYNVIECYNKIDRFFLKTKIKKEVKAIKSRFNSILQNADIFHAHSLYSNGTVTYELSLIYKKPFVLTIRNSDINNLAKLYKMHNSYKNLILRSAKSIIFVSKAGRDKFIKNIRNVMTKEYVVSHSTIIPNGISNSFFSTNNNEPIIKKISGNPKLLFVGRNDKNKNVLYVAKSIQKFNLKCKLSVVGRAVNNLLENKLSKYNFVERIDALPVEKIKIMYYNADIFVMCSKTETFGLAYIEALSQGTPILYTKNTGIDGTFPEGKVGFQINIKSKKDFCNKYNYLVDYYEKIQPNCQRESYLFSWDHIIVKFIELYAEIISSSKNE